MTPDFVKGDLFKNINRPVASDVHVNRPLTNFAMRWMQDESAYTALRIMPNIPVQKQGDLYYEFSRADLLRDDMGEWADGSETEGGGYTLSTDPYYCRVYGYHTNVTDRQRANQDEVVKLDQTGTAFVSRKAMIKRERLMTSTFMAANIWTNNADGSGNDFVQWDLANSDPIDDITNACTTVHGKTGFRPNKGAMGRPVFDKLKTNDEILARITGGATNQNPAKVTKEQIAALFELEMLEILDAVVNTAIEGKAENTDFVLSDGVLIYYAPASVGIIEPTAGVSFSWTGLTGLTDIGHRISRYRDQPKRADKIEIEMAFVYQVTASELGYYFTNVIS